MSDLIHQMVERNAYKYPDDLSLICHVTDSRLTWQEENNAANQIAHLLQNNGLKANDNIAILFSNQVEFVLSYLAVLKLGARVIPMNVRLTSNEIKQIVNSMDVKAVIYHPSLESIIHHTEVPTFSLNYKDMSSLSNYSIKNLNTPLTAEDIGEILLTSGTTGTPKGVMLSHRAIYQAGMMMAYEMQIKYQDRVLQMMPLSHSAPLNLTFVGSLFAGATSILDNFLPDKLLEHTENDKATHFFGAPVAYLFALKILQKKEYDLTSMKKWIYGGAPMPSNYLAVLKSKFPGEFVGVYGLTEAGPNGFALYHEEHEKHIGTIGKRSTVNTEYRLVDDKGTDLPAGKEGEILLKTSSIMSGYYNNPEATEDAIVDGWLHTGDIGKIDEDGYVHVIDRKKDVIISGGVNIFPSEIEKAIIEIEGIADVAAVSRPHEEWGETVVAVMVRNEGSTITIDEIKDSLKDKLAKYKIPREFIFTKELPRNASGKILKHKLREEFQ